MPVLEADAKNVIARDEDGHPVMIRGSLGKGKTLLLVLPFSHASSKARLNCGDDDMQILYQLIRDEMGIRAMASADRPCVETGLFMNKQNGKKLLIVINHRPMETVEGTINLGFPAIRAKNWSTGEWIPVENDGSGCHIPYRLVSGEALKVILN